jgi:hypothetical protein
MVSELTDAISDMHEAAKKISPDVGRGYDVDVLVKKLVGPVITYVGRDRAMSEELKSRFPVVQTFATVTSNKYASRRLEDILVVHRSCLDDVNRADADSGVSKTIVAWGGESDELRDQLADDLFHCVVSKTDAINIVSSIFQQNRDTSLNLDDLSADFEKQLLEKTLEKCNGSQAAAAKALGLAQNTLHYKLGRHGLLKSRPKRSGGRE